MRAWMLAMLVLAMVLGTLCAGCGCDDDDDDDDSDTGDDDSGDDDDTDDDADDDLDDDTDDDTASDCEGYDLTIEGVTEATSGDQNWVARLDIDVPTGTITGLVEPEDMDPYDVTGFRNDAQTGYVEGSFPRPEEIPDGVCGEDMIANHMDFVVVAGAVTGTVTFYCGTIDELNELFVYDSTGTVTCGDFAM